MRVALSSLLFAVLCTLACATNPVTGKREFSLMSEAQEIQIGQESDQQIRQEMGLVNDARLQEYVDRIGQQLARVSQRPTLPWHFAVVDVPVVNAFALPGGYIYVTRGILPYLDSEAQLAGVVGHEIGHVTARHAAQQYTRSTTGGLGLAALGIFVPATRPATSMASAGLGVLFLRYGREDELQADRLGVDYGAKAGWQPRGVSEMLQTLGRIDQSAPDKRGIPNWLSTHPQPADRVQRIDALVAEAETRQPQWRTEREAYLQAIDGVVFGDDPREGFVRGAEFLHPELRFAVTFPAGWPVNNGRNQVTAKSPNVDHYMLLDVVTKPQGNGVAAIAAADMAQAKFTGVSGSETTINGIPAFAGTWSGVVEDVPVTVSAGYLSDGARVYRLIGLAPTASYAQADPMFAKSIRSFRRLNASEAANVQPSRVHLYTARAGDTWQSIAERNGNLVKPDTLAIMNDHDPADPPRAGERLKIVVAG
jgi:predicted Zn-dependent protease